MHCKTLHFLICVGTECKYYEKSFSCGISGSWLTRHYGESHATVIPMKLKKTQLVGQSSDML